MRKHKRPPLPLLPVSEAADDFYRHVDSTITVAGRAILSCAAWEGVNRVLFSEGLVERDRQVAAVYREDNAHATVIRLAALLDRNSHMVSFQRLYRHASREAVRDHIIQRRTLESWFPERTEERARSGLTNFLTTYTEIFKDDLHGRLTHFRNRGVAHIMPHDIARRVTYGEISQLARAVAKMSDSLIIFATDDFAPLVRGGEIDHWVDDADRLWRRALVRD